MLALVAAIPAAAATVATPTLALAATQVGSCLSSPNLTADAQSIRSLKSEAILGGATSALERMRMSQALPSTSNADLTTASATDPAKGDDTCRLARAMPELIVPSVPAVAPLSSSRSTDFLGSARIPIGKTRFDADWARVSARHLSAQVVERSMGAPAADRLALIGQVNRWVNQSIAYRADSPRLHGGDYWADASQTLQARRGDCEDIAILKYQALLSLGIEPGNMYLTIARDLVRHADHALLVVKHAGRFYLLDDSTDDLLDGSLANDYRPILSFGEGKWLHGLPAARQPAIYLSRNELSSPRVSGVVR
jgi:predicted transglutaminase-like cysteine proteinase